MRPQLETLRIGFQRYGLLPLLKATGALDRGLEPHGMHVEWRELPSGIALVEALQSAALGLGLVGEGPAVFAQAARIPMVYLAAEPPAPDREAIIVHPGSPIRSVSELRGRTVMLSRGSNVLRAPRVSAGGRGTLPSESTSVRGVEQAVTSRLLG